MSDKIYSRPRIKIPQIAYYGKRNNRNFGKIIKIILIVIIAVFVMINVLRSIDPIFERVCKARAESIVTIEVNKITTNNILKYENSDMITIKNDDDGNIKMLQVNSNPLNNMISDITNDIQLSLNDNNIIKTSIPFGSITGIKWISGIGPNIPLKISLAGNIQTKIRNEFKEAGINQTIHKLWLDITCSIAILTPYKVEETVVLNEVILSENIIVGGVPNVYLDSEKQQ